MPAKTNGKNESKPASSAYKDRACLGRSNPVHHPMQPRQVLHILALQRVLEHWLGDTRSCGNFDKFDLMSDLHGFCIFCYGLFGVITASWKLLKKNAQGSLARFPSAAPWQRLALACVSQGDKIHMVGLFVCLQKCNWYFCNLQYCTMQEHY